LQIEEEKQQPQRQVVNRGKAKTFY
jgi:hypothetical protein